MALLGMILPAMALFPVPIAIYWILGAYRRSLSLLMLALLLAAVSSMAFDLPTATWLTFGAAAAMGIPIGIVLQYRISFGTATLALAVLGGIWAGGVMLLDWEVSQETADIFFSARVEQMEEAAENTEAGMEQNAAEMFRWLGENWEFLVFGIVFGFVYIATALALAILRLLVPDHIRMRGSLKDCRPPETLVLLAIVLALLWMVDQWWWHTVPMRLVVWNGAMALMMVYLFNGFSILLYALYIFQAPPIVYAFVVITVLLLGSTLGLHPVFLGFGFFDTWFNFRKRFRILAKVQKLQKKRNNKDTSNEE